MAHDKRTVAPGGKAGHVRLESGEDVPIPAGWAHLPPGDAGLTRRVKASGPSWTIQEKKGRRTFSRGVLAPAAIIEQARAAIDAERASPAYQKKLDASRRRRAKEHEAYVAEFHAEVLAFLAFAPRYAAFADELARAVTAHATPVGSGTVARTKRISVDRRAEAAVIAWLRHQTTAYDDMAIERRKGARREVRRMLATRSRKLLDRYRRGGDVDLEACPLAQRLMV